MKFYFVDCDIVSMMLKIRRRIELNCCFMFEDLGVSLQTCRLIALSLRWAMDCGFSVEIFCCCTYHINDESYK